MEILIVETENTQRGCTIDEILAKHDISNVSDNPLAQKMRSP